MQRPTPPPKARPDSFYFKAFGIAAAVVCVLQLLSPWLTNLIARTTGITTGGDGYVFAESLFAGIAMSAVIVTLWMQRDELRLQKRELRLQRRELKLQREEVVQNRKVMEQQRDEAQHQANALTKQVFESGFFQLMQAVLDQQRSIAYRQDGEVYLSDGALSEAAHNLKLYLHDIDIEELKQYHRQYSFILNDSVIAMWTRSEQHKFVPEDLLTRKASFVYHNRFRGYFDSYVRIVTKSIIQIDKADLSKEQKRWYVSLIAARMTEPGLTLLLYYTFTHQGRSELATPAWKYGLFDNLSDNGLAKPEHRRMSSSIPENL
jgi:hypothetical protein